MGQPRGAAAAHRARHGRGWRVLRRNVRRATAADARLDTTSQATRVVRLENGPGGSTLHLVGVSHVLVDDAVRDVQTLMRDLRPDAVVLELCAERAPAAMRAALAGVSSESPLPAVIPRSVRIEGLPSNPIPELCESQLLSKLAARQGAVVTPNDLAEDRNALHGRGIFGQVSVDVVEGDGETNDGALYCAMRDTKGTTGDSQSIPNQSTKSESIPKLTEAVRVDSIVFRVTPDPTAAVTADVRFSWGRNARHAFGDRERMEGKIVSGALQVLETAREAGEEVDADEEGDDDHDDEDEYEDDEESVTSKSVTSERWEGVFLRSALAEAAAVLCPGAIVSTVSHPGTLATDVDEGGVVWVTISIGGERTFPVVDSRDPQRDALNGRKENDENQSKTDEDEDFAFATATRAFRSARNALSSKNTTATEKVYLLLSELAQELVSVRLDQKSPSGYETVAALVSAIETGADVVVLGDVSVSETLRAVVGDNDDPDETSDKKEMSSFAAFKSLIDTAKRTVFSDPKRLREEIQEALRTTGLQNEIESNNESENDAALVNALVTRRDASLFHAAWSVAGGDHLKGDAEITKMPAYVRVRDEPDVAESTYSFDPEWTPIGVGKKNKVVAVVGAAHVDGIATRWREKSKGLTG